MLQKVHVKQALKSDQNNWTVYVCVSALIQHLHVCSQTVISLCASFTKPPTALWESMNQIHSLLFPTQANASQWEKQSPEGCSVVGVSFLSMYDGTHTHMVVYRGSRVSCAAYCKRRLKGAMLLLQQLATSSVLKGENPKPANVTETVTLMSHNALKTCHPQSVASPFTKHSERMMDTQTSDIFPQIDMTGREPP